MEATAGLAKNQQHTLDRLKTLQCLQGFYLVGGSAVAHHLHHRTSQDLDIFSMTHQVDLEAIRLSFLEALPQTKVLGMSDATLKVEVEGVPVDIVRYPYPPLEAPVPGPCGFPTASLIDLATMKLAAIARRGIRRDFWDLYEMALSGLDLRDASRAYLRRFGVKESDLYHVFRSLTYFDDAEKDKALPEGLSKKKWEEIKAFFCKQAPLLLADE